MPYTYIITQLLRTYIRTWVIYFSFNFIFKGLFTLWNSDETITDFMWLPPISAMSWNQTIIYDCCMMSGDVWWFYPIDRNKPSRNKKHKKINDAIVIAPLIIRPIPSDSLAVNIYLRLYMWCHMITCISDDYTRCQ